MCSEEIGAKTENLRELRRMDEWKERGRGAGGGVLNITQYGVIFVQDVCVRPTWALPCNFTFGI